MSCGIYLIENLVTGHLYIGKSIDVEKRFSAHRRALKNGRHFNYKIQHDLEKHGIDSFFFELIIECEEYQLLELEQQFLNNYTPFYNIAENTKAPMLGLKHSHESRKKISMTKTGTTHSIETRRKLTEIQNKKFPQIACSNGIVYKSQREAARSLGLSLGDIWRQLNGKQSHVKGYKFWKK